jgi:hypothetical protein
MSLSLFSSWGDFFSAKSATATSLLNSLEIAILRILTGILEDAILNSRCYARVTSKLIKHPVERIVGAALCVFIIMTYFTDRYHDILYS